MKRSHLHFLAGTLAAGVAGITGLLACGGQGFDPQSKVDSVRLLAVKADKPYVTPGDTVTLEALYTDQRQTKPRPLQNYWIPLICLNPRDDLYYLCFLPSGDGGPGSGQLIPVGPLAGTADGGGAPQTPLDAGTNPFSQLPAGVDITPFLQTGPTFSFQMPADAIQPREGDQIYGLAIIFNVTCAGHVEIAGLDPNGGPQQVPVICADENGNKLPPSDYVIGISRVYSYPNQTNANPIIDKVTLDGVDVDPVAGITVDRCPPDKKSEDCPSVDINVVVPESSWELNPSSGSENLHEQIWVDYYSNRGDLANDARLLFDTRQGRVDDSAVKFRASKDPGDGLLWMVVHDNRAGAAWIVVPVHVK
ncbi:hypothetical protein AKJ09_06590 [Labilithrix luteola]|uniref:Lipoprotein n=1 Tax=Labilithrix luteola TaxID=1391654 RepID=A0A0K1Q2Q8_9BACT|nr:hypothetical protein [Labilithrix luteola]AKU99926.1 hypothetical protein AKJ09_06590 [Labilithrix luteola]